MIDQFEKNAIQADDIHEIESVGSGYRVALRSGICHTCIADLTDGEVDYLEAPLDEPAEGQVLICCARPRTSLIIEI